MMRMNQKDLFKELLIDKTKQVESLVKKAKNILGIDRESGDTIILVSRAKLTDEEMICIHLIGRFFSSELGLVESSSVSYKELSKKTGIKESVVAARLHDLKKEGYIRSPKRGEHEIVFPRISEFLDIILQKVGFE